MSDQKVCPTCGTEYPLSERFCPRDGTALRPADSTGDLVGTIVAERYHILKKLGEGGMGTVFLAEHVKMGRKAALKVMNSGMSSHADAIARFNREAANASRLNHPNICGIYDFGETPEGLIYLAMEFVDGESLASLIEKNGALAAPRAASIIHQAADALAVAHDCGIVHRDLKPDNIMIAKNRDGSDLVKVVDFGIAKASSSAAQKVTKTGLVVGTPEYMSPEQLSGDKLDGRSDIYSLGLVAFNSLTETLPFPSESAQEMMIMRLTDEPKTLADMRPDITWPPALQAVIDKALAREVGRRYPNAAEFGREIAKAVENMPLSLSASAATQVMGVASAQVTAAVDAELPPTRVAASRAPATKQVGAVAAPAPAKRSSVGLVAGIVAVLVVGGGAFVFWPKGPAKPAVDAAAPLAKAPASDSVPAGGSKQADPPATKSADATSQKSGSRVPQDSKAPAQQPVAPQQVTSAPPTASTAIIARWDSVFQNNDKVGDAEARQGLADMLALIPKLAGQEKSNAYYVQMVASISLEDPDHLCPAAKEIESHDGNTNHVKAAKRVLSDLCAGK